MNPRVCEGFFYLEWKRFKTTQMYNGQPTLEARRMSWMNSIGSNEQVVATLEEAWGVATMTF